MDAYHNKEDGRARGRELMFEKMYAEEKLESDLQEEIL